MFHAAVGHSEDIDAADAAKEALDQCSAALRGPPSGALVFAGSSLDHRLLLAEIQARHPHLPVVGGSSMAEASSRLPHAESSAVVMMFSGDRIDIAAGYGAGADRDPAGAASRAVDVARETLRTAPRVCVCVSNGTRSNLSLVLDGLSRALGPDVVIVGGASSCERPTDYDSHEFCGAEVLRDSVSVLLFGGAVRATCSVERGWTPVGQQHQITRAEGNVVMEIDGRPALELYQRYLGVGGAAGVMFVHHPLWVREDEVAEPYLRAAVAPAPAPGGIVFGGSVPERASVQLTEFTRENVIAAAKKAAVDARATWGQAPPAAALVVSCATRQRVLGTWTEREIEALGAQLPGVPFAGFYAFGELSPGRPPRVQNSSFVTLLLGEA
jgi:hypothetical protein